MGKVKTGARYCSRVCATQIIVVRCLDENAELTCGGQPMSIFGEEAARTSAKEGFQGGNELGKRYADSSGVIEVLVTKAGEGTLGIGDLPLVRKETAQLPASD